ncbi:hypothetical protein Tco_1046768 [Tanacetum coccineum]
MILSIPRGVESRKKSFKFSNFVADKSEFLIEVEKEWSKNSQGCHMFKVVKKMRNLKYPMKKLNWKEGNLFDKVNQLKNDIQDIQKKIDCDPYDKELRKVEAMLLQQFLAASKDEEKLLLQKSRIKWLSYGDKNNSWFHKVIKSNQQRNRVLSICDEDGRRFDGNEVAEQFVKHFKNFLGVEYPVSDIEDSESLFLRKVSNEDALIMIKDVTNKEIKDAMFDIGDNQMDTQLIFSRRHGPLLGRI